MNDAELRNYAETMVKNSENELKGKVVIIFCSVANYNFAKLVADCISAAGALEVKLNFASGDSGFFSYWNSCTGIKEDYPILMLKNLQDQAEGSVVMLYIGSFRILRKKPLFCHKAKIW